ncbi:hemicentin-1-like [Panonychus citri]|uniref:hemicentin-1-like n=1 Tax=Panonychus citri TaxID=50023 RepID=UPI0023080D59|nr:hemicentin-1-like [Panonychus citri]
MNQPTIGLFLLQLHVITTLSIDGISSLSSSSSSSGSEIPPYLVFQDRSKIEPYFDNTTSKNITTSAGKSVFLPCRVHHIGDRTVSWIRRRDLNVLTVGKYTYTPDQRFQAVHMENSDDWSLQIGYTSKSDAGIYECQVSTRPPKSLFVNLNVVVSQAKIAGSPTVYFSSDNTLNLTCIVDGAPGPPDFIFWYHNGEVINYNSPRKIKVQLVKGAQAMSILTINKSMPSDSGNYSCVPSNADSAHIAVHVHNNGGQPAAMQHGKRSAESLINSSPSRLTINPIINYLFNPLNQLFTSILNQQSTNTCENNNNHHLQHHHHHYDQLIVYLSNVIPTIIRTLCLSFCLPLWLCFVKDFQSIR